MDHVLVFQLGWWYPNYLLNSHLRFTGDGEGGTTSHRGIGVLSILKVRVRQVDGQAAVIAEALRL